MNEKFSKVYMDSNCKRGMFMKKSSMTIGKNKLWTFVNKGENFPETIDNIVSSWENALSYIAESKDVPGFRSAQLGALFAIKSHWTVSETPVTIVMPTGTGKTETMISAVISEKLNRTLIIVPSTMLRTQTAEKFASFGILKNNKLLKESAKHPVVCNLRTTPADLSEMMNIVERANVIVTTINLINKFSEEYLSALKEKCDALIVDEAHHIAANTWSTLKHNLKNLKCLQFTATPYRNDNKKIDGKIIYNFPLSLAQKQGYFEKINFHPIQEFDEEKGDLSIASKAVEQLQADIKNGYEHIILVRANNIDLANKLYKDIYSPLYGNYNPVLIHSGLSTVQKKEGLRKLKSGEAKIVVCVDMFGEGIDIPNLKIAAIHHKYKSLPITIQFIGRFARTANKIGPATIITNIANDELSDTMKELYAQDSDWNSMLNILSDTAIGKEVKLQELYDGFNVKFTNDFSIQQIRPKISMVAYKTSETQWYPERLKKVFKPETFEYTINEEKNVIVVVERTDSRVEWTSFKGISDINWELHIIYWNKAKKLFYVNSTNKSIDKTIAKALFDECMRIEGEHIFRSLNGINRLMLASVGLNSAFDGPIRYKMFAGIDIAEGISETQKSTSTKSNLFGVGYEQNGKISIGCSYKGRVWSRWVESIDFWMEWCDSVADKLIDDNIDTKNVLSNVLIPKKIKERPKVMPYLIDWPLDLSIVTGFSVKIETSISEYQICDFDIKLLNATEDGPIEFMITNGSLEECFALVINDKGYKITCTKSSDLKLVHRNLRYSLEEFFDNYPPQIKFVDQSTLEGDLQVSLKSSLPKLSEDQIKAQDWTGTNIKKESQDNERLKDSIQYRIIQDMIASGKYSVIFDDDGSGEISDIVGFIEEDDQIIIQLYHCKYSSEDKPGARVNDLYEVCGQAEKSIKWCQNPIEIITRIISREARKKQAGYSRFNLGDMNALMTIRNKMRFYKTRIRIGIVQPGMDSKKISPEMETIMCGTSAFLKDTYGITLEIICS